MTLYITNATGTEVKVTVVPAEPSEAQHTAGYKRLVDEDHYGDAFADSGFNTEAWDALHAYRAMLSAADPSLVDAVVELRRACEAAAKTFRWYEELHRAKGPEHADKAARNRVEAEKLEAALSRIRETDDAG